jgi:hypothetical protein
MKKTLPIILVAYALYYLWWKSKQDKTMPSPPQLDNSEVMAARTMGGFPTVY